MVTQNQTLHINSGSRQQLQTQTHSYTTLDQLHRLLIQTGMLSKPTH